MRKSQEWIISPLAARDRWCRRLMCLVEPPLSTSQPCVGRLLGQTQRLYLCPQVGYNQLEFNDSRRAALMFHCGPS